MPSRAATADDGVGDGNGQEGPVLFCYLSALRPIASLLSAISFSNRANVEVLEDGLRFDVDIGKTVKAHAYLQSGIFDEYTFNAPIATSSARRRPAADAEDDDDDDDAFNVRPRRDEPEDEDLEPSTSSTTFEISLATMVEVLNVFGTAGVKKGKAAERDAEDIDSSEEDEHPGGGIDGDRGGKWKDKKRQKEIKPTSALRMTWEGEGAPLVLLIEDSGTLTRCELQTYEAAPMADISFPHENRIVKLIMRSNWLASAFREFDERSSPTLHIIYHPPPPPVPTYASPQHRQSRKQATETGKKAAPFRLEAQGAIGSVAMDFPDEREIIDTLEWNDEVLDDPEVRRRMQRAHGTGSRDDSEGEGEDDEGDWQGRTAVKFGYKLGHMAKIKPALAASHKVSLRTDDEGILSLQFMIPLGKSGPQTVTNGYVEFICLPLEEDEE